MSDDRLEYFRLGESNRVVSRRRTLLLDGILIGGFLTVPAVFLSMLSGGSGHGDYILARVIFPYGMFLSFTLGNISNSWVVAIHTLLFGVGTGPHFLALVIAALVQYPLYGGIVGYFAITPKRLMTLLLILAVLHAAVTSACLLGHA